MSLVPVCPTFFSRGPNLLFQNFCGPKFILWDYSFSKKIVVCPKLGEEQEKKDIQPTNLDGFSGVLQRTNKTKIKNSHL